MTEDAIRARLDDIRLRHTVYRPHDDALRAVLDHAEGFAGPNADHRREALRLVIAEHLGVTDVG